MGQAHRFSGAGKPFEGLTTLRKGKVDWTGKTLLVPKALAEPLSWRKPARVFVNSMSDLFHRGLTNEEIASVFGVMAACPHLTFQILTKRADRLPEWFAWVGTANLDDLRAYTFSAASDHREREWLYEHLGRGTTWPLPNVHLGVSCEDQKTADERIPFLLKTPAAVRFVSAEPLLGPLRLDKLGPWYEPGFDTPREVYPFLGTMAIPDCDTDVGKLDWVIVGGESGPGARPCDVAWIRSVIQQCKDARVACFVKQLGRRPIVDAHDTNPSDWGDDVLWDEHGPAIRTKHKKAGDISEWAPDLRVREFPGGI
jgi:protein gp37